MDLNMKTTISATVYMLLYDFFSKRMLLFTKDKEQGDSKSVSADESRRVGGMGSGGMRITV
jgi:hypothetical protein